MNRIHDIGVATTALIVVALGGACGSSGHPLHGDAGQQDASLDVTGPDGAGEEVRRGPTDASTDALQALDLTPDGGDDELTVPVFEPTLSASGCTATTAAVAIPLLVDALFACDTSAGQLSVAAGADGNGFVALSNTEDPVAPALLFTIGAAGSTSVSRGPKYAGNVRVLADAAGQRFLAGDDSLRGTGVVFYAPVVNAWEVAGWSREPVAGPRSPSPGLFLANARLSADGHAFVVYDDSLDSTLHARARDAAGTWTAVSDLGAASGSALTLDADQQPHVLTLPSTSFAAGSDFGVTDWQPGHASVPWAGSWSSYVGGFAAATRADGALALALRTKAGVQLVTSKAGEVASQLLTDTQDLRVTGCPPLPVAGNLPTTPTMCTEQGKGTSAAVGIAATDDGALWIAYLLETVDRDVTQMCVPFEGVIQCFNTTTADRSMGEMVLVKIAGGTPTVAWRAPLAGEAGMGLALDARASRLHLAFALNVSSAPTARIRYVVLDAAKL